MTVSISDVDIPASGEVTQSIGDDNDQGLKDGVLPKTESLELSAPESIATEEKKGGENEGDGEEKEMEEEEKEKEEQKRAANKESKMSKEVAKKEKEKEKEALEKKEKVIKKDDVKTIKTKESKSKPTSTSASKTKTTSTSKTKSTPKTKPKPKFTHILSSTLLSEADRDVLVSLVSSLGDAKFISRSSRSITLLVAGQDVRSVKMMCAVARGIPVVTPAWLYACLEQGKWVEPDSFISSFAEEGLKKRREQEKGILAKHGPYFIAKNTQPPRNELIEIVRCCDGQITDDLDECEFVIGKVEGREYVKETFVLDGVMKGELPRISEYIVKEEEESDEFYPCLFTNNGSDRSCQNRIQLVTVGVHLHFQLVYQVYKRVVTSRACALLFLVAIQSVVARGAHEMILFDSNCACITKEIVLFVRVYAFVYCIAAQKTRLMPARCFSSPA